MSERTEVWEPPGPEPDQPAESGQLSETRLLPSVDAPPVDEGGADTMVVEAPADVTLAVSAVGADTVVPEVTGDSADTVTVDGPPDAAGVATLMVGTRPADGPSTDTVAVRTTAPDSSSAEEELEVRARMPSGESERRAPAISAAPLPFPLGVTAALVGEYRWIEHALYALLGRWVQDAPLAGVKVHLDAQSMRHAWHAEMWADRLPVLAGSNHDRLTVPSPPAAALFRMLGASIPRTVTVVGGGSTTDDGEDPGEAAPELPGTLPRLAGLYRVVLPRLVVSYERHLAATAVPTDGPIIRALRLVLNDEIEDWRAGEQLIERLMTRPHDVAAVVDFQHRLESALVGAGGRSGLVRIPDSAPRR